MKGYGDLIQVPKAFHYALDSHMLPGRKSFVMNKANQCISLCPFHRWEDWSWERDEYRVHTASEWNQASEDHSFCVVCCLPHPRLLTLPSNRHSRFQAGPEACGSELTAGFPSVTLTLFSLIISQHRVALRPHPLTAAPSEHTAWSGIQKSRTNSSVSYVKVTSLRI